MSSSDSCRGSAISAAGAARAVIAERLVHGCLVRGVQTKRGDSCNQCHVGRFNKAMTTTLLNTTGYEFISSLAQCTRAASVVQQ